MAKKSRKRVKRNSPSPPRATKPVPERSASEIEQTTTPPPTAQTDGLKHSGGVFRRNRVEIVLIAAAVVHALAVSLAISPSYDEGKHIINGIAYLENKACCLSDESPFAGAH